jgi:hypothetical protein
LKGGSPISFKDFLKSIPKKKIPAVKISAGKPIVKPSPQKLITTTPKPEPVVTEIRQDPVVIKPQREPPCKPVMQNDSEKEFLKIFKRLTYRHRPWDIWRDFVTMFACTISNSLDKTNYNKREELYLRTIHRYNKDEQNMFPELVTQIVMAMEQNPEQDFLGHIFMNLELGNVHTGQFFTPYDICDMMARVTLSDVVAIVERNGYISINDPCCGAGSTLIAGIHEAKRQLEKVNLNFQNHVLVVGQEIDFIVALMCYIQISLLGVAGFIKVGNTFTEPMSDSDSTENYWFTPMYFFDVWSTRRILRKMSSIMKGENHQ